MILPPGIYSDIPEAEYRESEGAAQSDLKNILRSPLHFWANRLDPEREPENTDTDAKVFGRITHKMIFEPKVFGKFYHVAPDIRRAGPAWKEQVEAAQGREIIKQPKYDLARRMADVVHAHPEASKLLTGLAPEQTMYWNDPITGVRCKGRVDGLGDRWMADYKSTEDARESAFSRSVFNYGYQIQDAFYSQGHLTLKGSRIPFVFIAQEKSAPFAVRIYTLDERAKELGREAYLAGLEIYKRCKESGEYPGYESQVKQISLPGWATKQLEV